MKIDGLNSTAPLASNGKAKPTAGSRPQASATPQDSVAIGQAASLAAGGEAPVDAAKVQQIRQAISEGRFQINPGAIADRLIESAKELIQAQRTA